VVPVISAIAKLMSACLRGEQVPFADNAQLVIPEVFAPKALQAAG
jgi:hypothetical protein